MVQELSIGLSTFGDHASGVLKFDAFQGTATVATHGCASPDGQNPGGSGYGSASHARVITCQVTSTTLPVGTPVTIEFKVSGSKSVSTIFVPDPNGNSGNGGATASVDLTISLGNGAVIFHGDGYQSAALPNQPGQNTIGGLYQDPTGQLTGTFVRHVGDTFSFSVSLGAIGYATAGVQMYGDAKGNFSLCWGASVIDGDAQIKYFEDDKPFPGVGNATPEHAAKILPPPPVLGECYPAGECPLDYYCAKPMGQCEAAGTCTPLPGGCGPEYDPVCGCDGVTYVNACHAAAAGMNVAYTGGCKLPCKADVAGGKGGGDGVVNVDDLLAIINGWGPCPKGCQPCPTDIAPPQGDCATNVDDLLAVINGWGECP